MNTIKPLDIASYLKSPEDINQFLENVAEEGNAEDFIHALGIAARARGMTQVAQEIGVTRASLYKSLNQNGKPQFQTIANVCHSLGLRLTVKPIHHH